MSLAVVAVAGCGSGLGTNGSPSVVVDGNRDQNVTSPLGKTFGEPNDSFFDPIVAVFDSNGVARLQGTVSITGDLDVFLLGSLSPGDRLIVDASTTGSALDVSVALFDDAGRLAVHNDDREDSTGRFLDSYIEWIVRHAGDPYYLVVTHAAFADRGRLTGTYSVDVEIESGSDVPEPVGQILSLDFNGGQVTSPTLGPMTLAPFDAGAISPVYRGQSEALKQQIRAVMEQNYERFNVAITTSDDPPPAAGVCFSTIYIGGFSPGEFGIAESVDSYNTDYCDDAIIYAESFTPLVFTTTPSVAGLGVAIANVAAHEAGHLLGLNHVDDDWALMDDHSPADAFLEDQEFKEAPMSSDIMLIGKQDAVLLLTEIVGLFEF